ncbi:hypothetical protein E1B06_22115 [Brevibacillus laterosporus]|uniref:hypothetical protein n=1 Tax=Brevibacillus laterosporus TaxID=1465 RepID=UPI00240720C2|nr:hypothetical protein [Brevibacillus laterosporus]MDF9414321.1 hypothetical protein [Brevibacillus laterosporus]
MKLKLWSCFLVLLLLVGCNSSSVPNEKEVMEITLAYNKARFELNQKDFSVKDKQELFPEINERMKQYSTEKVYQEFVRIRGAGYAIEAAKLGKAIQVKEITISKLEEVEKSLNVDYNMIVQINSSENNETSEHKVLGQLTLIKENDSWKIDRVWDSFTFKELGL